MGATTRLSLGSNLIPPSFAGRAGGPGVALLLAASTLNGLTADVTLARWTVTIRPDQVILVLLAPLVLSALRATRGRLDQPLLHLPVVVMFLANLAASALHSPLRAMSIQGTVLMGVYVSMYFATVILLAEAPVWARQMPVLLVRLGIVQAACGLGAFLLFSEGIDVGGVSMDQVVVGAPSVHTTFVEGNLLGAFLALVCALIAIELVTGGDHRRLSGMLFAGFCLCGLTLVLTLTRSAWIALLLVLVGLMAERLMVTHSVRATLRASAPIVAGLAIIVTVSAAVLDPLLSRPGGERSVLRARVTSLAVVGDLDQPSELVQSRVTMGSRSAIVGRFELLRMALDRWPEAPLLGHGTFAGEVIGQRYWMSSGVQAIYDTGVIGLVSLVALQMLMIAVPWYEARRAADSRLRASLLGCAAGNAVLAFTSLLSSFLWLGFAWVFMGITMALATAARRSPRPTASAPMAVARAVHPAGTAH